MFVSNFDFAGSSLKKPCTYDYELKRLAEREERAKLPSSYSYLN